MTGGVLLTASLILIIRIFINRENAMLNNETRKQTEPKEEKVDTVSKEGQTEQAQEFERPLCAGTLTRMRSSSAVM